MDPKIYELVHALTDANTTSSDRLIRPKNAAAMLGVSKKQLYIIARQEDFPEKIQIGSRAVGWRLSDLKAWIDSRSLKKEEATI